MEKAYISIDLKSFYASVELAERQLDPLTTHLVVADSSRTEKTICLAVSPSLKAYGIPGRARLFEVNERISAVNAQRFRKAAALGLLPKDPETGAYGFTGASADEKKLAADPSLKLDFIIAPPQMLRYEQISAGILRIYRKYVSPEDIHVYSIDECFIDATGYLKTYGMTARELAVTMIRDVLHKTGITATAGIGTNLYLAKIAMDIVSKHVRPDEDGVRIAELDEAAYRKQLWYHQPLTDFWRVGKGIAARLGSMGCHTMGDIARMSLTDEDRLYAALGVNAELLIDHAWGWEPTEISMIRSYKPESGSLSAGQVLPEPYDFEMAKLIVREMTEVMVLDLVRRGLVTRQVILTIHYDRSSIRCEPGGSAAGKSVWLVARTGRRYTGEVASDFYGRPSPKVAQGTGNLDHWTSSARRITDVMMSLYDRIVDPELTIRRIGIAVCEPVPADSVPAEAPVQLDLFTDYKLFEKQKQEESAADAREKNLQMAALGLHGKFGKNALLKGMNLMEGATTVQRNRQIGGHRAGSEAPEAQKGSKRHDKNRKS